MDAIDSLLGWVRLRKNSGGSDFERGRLNLIEGSNVTITVADDAANNEIDVTIAAGGATVGYGTSLPGSPTDGQEYILVDSTTAPTYQWRFRYNAGGGTYKWEFIGGAPVVKEVATSETTNSTSYTALTTAGPSFSLPAAGVWQITVELEGHNNTNGGRQYMSYDIGGTGAVDADAAIPTIDFANQPADFASHTREKTIATAVTITAKYKVSLGTGTFANRVLKIVPVRVS